MEWVVEGAFTCFSSFFLGLLSDSFCERGDVVKGWVVGRKEGRWVLNTRKRTFWDMNKRLGLPQNLKVGCENCLSLF